MIETVHPLLKLNRILPVQQHWSVELARFLYNHFITCNTLSLDHLLVIAVMLFLNVMVLP